MKNLRSFYSAPIPTFIEQPINEILGTIHANSYTADTTIQQSNTWLQEISILKNQLAFCSEGHILFEYTIPRMGKRVDVVVILKNIVFLLEFKCGEKEYRASAYDQVYDYALDLQNFQKESHDKLLVPIVIATEAPSLEVSITLNNRIIQPIQCNATNIANALQSVSSHFCEPYFSPIIWENSEYLPTPTIIEAAQALYRGHHVQDITRSDASAQNLTSTTDEINRIINHSKQNNRKSICFVTGVPGAGKTLVGLNLAIQHANTQQGEHAVFLSGNFPLVSVLQEALARDKVDQQKCNGHKTSKTDAKRSTAAFIQIIHKYRDSFVGNSNVPPERIAIFDEAQRAWTKEKIKNFMKTKKGIHDFNSSEPEFLIGTMDRHQDWAVVVCLVGGGQEINDGEAGLPEWFDSLRRSYPNWDVYLTPQLNDEEYKRDKPWTTLISDLHIHERTALHLSTSVRSFRTPDLSSFVKSLLDGDIQSAREYYQRIQEKYPLVITRDLDIAKKWVKSHCQGTTRYGLLASSGALRLKPEGIFVKNTVSVENWFLNGKDDVRSSYAMEDVVSEFDIQGLELDYTLVAWDADYRFINQQWTFNSFTGSSWKCINSFENKLYLKNAYRVLLTRARQGMALFIPHGSTEDKTRLPEYYDGTYTLLKAIGIPEI